MARQFAQLASGRAINRHMQKSDCTWQLALTSEPTAKLPGKQRTSKIEYQIFSPIEHRVGEEEASHFGFTDIIGLVKLLIPGDIVITEDSKLLCDGEEVDIVRIPGRPNAGLQEYHIVYVRIRSEHPNVT